MKTIQISDIDFIETDKSNEFFEIVLKNGKVLKYRITCAIVFKGSYVEIG